MLGTHAARRWSVALAVGACASLFGAASAQAAFETQYTTGLNKGLCSGGSIVGDGASFQNNAHNSATGWIFQFRNNISAKTCGTAGPTVWPQTITYNGIGSGGGMDKWGRTAGNTPGYVRDANTRFVGTDDPPTAAQLVKMQGGDSTVATDNGLIRTIPVAVGAIAVVVNYPNNCTIPSASYYKPATGSTNYPQDGTTRFQISNARLEAAFAGDPSFDTWGELLPGITNTDGSTNCAAIPVTRVVRADSSGTTFSFKQFMKSINPSRTWEEPTLANQAWPNCTVATDPVATLHVGGGGCVKSSSNNGTNLAIRLSTIDGGIGYVALADARNNGYDMTPGTIGSPVNAPVDTTFWIPVRGGASGTTAIEPQKNAYAYKTGATSLTKGSRCAGVQVQNVPAGADPTLADASGNGNWASVTAIGSTVNYPACALTYNLAFDDYADVYNAGNQTGNATEEARARSVASYEQYITYGGQASLYSNDYAPLPTGLRTIAFNAAKSIGWAK